MSQQIIIGNASAGPSPTAVRYNSLGGLAPSWFVNESAAGCDMPAAGTISNLAIRVQTAPGAGTRYDIDVMINGSSSPATLTLRDTSTAAVGTGTATVAVGDKVDLRCTPSSTPANIGFHSMSWEWNGTVSNESVYLANPELLASTQTSYQGVFAQHYSNAWSTVRGVVTDVCPINGNLVRTQVKLDGTNIGAAGAYTYAIYKNGVRQDGTGGTPNTTVRLTGSGVSSGNSSYTVSLVPGDTVYAEVTQSSNPNNAGMGCSYTFQASSASDAIFAGHDLTSPSTVNTQWHAPQQSVAWSSTEASTGNVWGYVGPTTFRLGLKGSIANMSVGTFSGAAHTLTLRKNSTTTKVGALRLTGTSSQSTAAGSETFVSGDVISVQGVPSSNPSTSHFAWAFNQTFTANPAAGLSQPVQYPEWHSANKSITVF